MWKTFKSSLLWACWEEKWSIFSTEFNTEIKKNEATPCTSTEKKYENILNKQSKL